MVRRYFPRPWKWRDYILANVGHGAKWNEKHELYFHSLHTLFFIMSHWFILILPAYHHFCALWWNEQLHRKERDWLNTLRPRQNGRHFADDIFKCIFLNENVWIPIEISLKFVPKDPIDNILALVQIMAWRRPGDKPLSEPMMDSLLTHICVTRPQWVNYLSTLILTNRK